MGVVVTAGLHSLLYWERCRGRGRGRATPTVGQLEEGETDRGGKGSAYPPLPSQFLSLS